MCIMGTLTDAMAAVKVLSNFYLCFWFEVMADGHLHIVDFVLCFLCIAGTLFLLDF